MLRGSQKTHWPLFFKEEFFRKKGIRSVNFFLVLSERDILSRSEIRKRRVLGPHSINGISWSITCRLNERKGRFKYVAAWREVRVISFSVGMSVSLDSTSGVPSTCKAGWINFRSDPLRV